MSEKLLSVYQIPAQRGFQVNEAAEYLSMHPQTLRRMADRGEIPCRRVNKHRVFLLEDLDRWLESQPKWVAHGNS